MINISIITVCFNAKDGLINTIESVLAQNYTEFEMIVIDGGSTDGTKKILSSYEDEFKNRQINFQYISEKDSGIYDAMNKGVEMSSGEWCNFMNAGDLFYSNNSLKLLSNNINQEIGVIFGDAVHSYKNKYKISFASDAKELTFEHGMEFCHQASLIRKAILKRVPYDTNFNIAGDYDFFSKVFLNKVSFYHLEQIIAIFQKDGISSTYAGMVNLENNQIKFINGFITNEVFMRENLKARIKIFGRKYISKRLISIRQKRIMEKDIKNWYNFYEIDDIYNRKR